MREGKRGREGGREKEREGGRGNSLQLTASLTYKSASILS